jgi:hypothetical protein
MQRPERNEYAEYYEGYVSLVPETDIISVLAVQPEEMRALVGGLTEEKGLYAYADGKWTIKQVLGHLIDGDRVFGYRAHRISHGDQTPLAGFDQDLYVQNGRSNDRSFADLLDEFELLRRSNIRLFKSLGEADWLLSGTASNAGVTVRGLAFMMAGHVRHHSSILSERYLA